jgi:hypothetical protein
MLNDLQPHLEIETRAHDHDVDDVLFKYLMCIFKGRAADQMPCVNLANNFLQRTLTAPDCFDETS